MTRSQPKNSIETILIIEKIEVEKIPDYIHLGGGCSPYFDDWDK